MRSYFKKTKHLFIIEPDQEGDLSQAFLRFFTYIAIYLFIPPESFYQEFFSLNSAIRCADYLSYSRGLNLSHGAVEIVYGALRAALLLSSVGCAFFLASLVGFVSFSLLTIHSLSSCYSNHLFYPIGIVLLLWFINGNQSKYSIDRYILKGRWREKKSYIFSFLKIHFSLIFLFAGLSKLRSSGVEWVFSENLKNVLIMQNYFHQGFPGSLLFAKANAYIISSPTLTKFLGLLALLIELSAGLLLVIKRWRWAIVALIALLQVGFFVGLYISFYPWLVLYLVWIISALNEKIERIK